VTREERLARYGTVSAHLALLGDRRLRTLLDNASPLGTGIGGESVLVDVDGVKVFVKKVPITDRELLADNVMSTANLFGLPVFCQYGIGGPGFGAWRELAVHAMTTGWVLGDRFAGFPLMYHWRVLPAPAPEMPEELADVDSAVEYWEGSPAVRERIEAIAGSSASMVLFLEYLPQNLHDWLEGELARGGDAAESACTMVERELLEGVSFMNSHDLLHFDAHFANIMTDGRRLYFGDFGLSTTSRFELSDAERAFYAGHLAYDRCYTVTHLVHTLVKTFYGYDRPERDALVRACAEGRYPADIPDWAAEMLLRHAPIATMMFEFNRKLQTESRTTPYPVEGIRRVFAAEESDAVRLL
jgi:hypothetical protein